MLVFYIVVTIGTFWYAVEKVFSEEDSKIDRVGASFMAAILWPIILGRRLDVWLDEDE